MTDRPILFSGPTWRPIRGYEGRYEVSDAGMIRSLSTYRAKRPTVLKPWTANKGYQYVSLRDGEGARKTHSVHRLVLEAFVEERHAGKQAAHNNGNPEDNRLSNLRWATAKENIADRAAHGRTVMGEAQHGAKLDRHAVKTIKKMRDSGIFSAYETARVACVSPSTILSIWRGDTWKHV